MNQWMTYGNERKLGNLVAKTMTSALDVLKVFMNRKKENYAGDVATRNDCEIVP